uniref:BZIP domain-containing protein n=1 Tax=Haemonchus contortus TaxID=6289 RepID=A0A7I4YHC9_HAECO
MTRSERSRRRGRVRRSSSSSSCDSCSSGDRRVATRIRAALAETSPKKTLKEHDEFLFPSFWFFAFASSLVLAPASITRKTAFDSSSDYDISSIMYGSLSEFDDIGFIKTRPIGVRWRDEATLARIAYNYTERMDYGEMTMMPLVTERPRSHLGRGPGQLVPTTSTAPQAPSQDDPSLEDLELIDVLWRNDIAAEKGARQLQPADQYELDLQLLTEKSIHAPLSAEESSRFEDLSKVYFEDFYAVPYVLRPGSKGQPQPPSRSDQLFGFEDDLTAKRELSTPTDEDLAELLEDVSKEGGQLDRLTCGVGTCPPPDLEPLPLVNNVSLSEGIVFTAQNISEMSMMQEQRQDAMASILTPPAPVTLYNETSMPNMWMQQAEMTPNDIYPNNGYMSFQNDTGVPVVSTGSQYDHQYHISVQSNRRDENRVGQSLYDPYYSARTTSFSNESSSVCSSSSTAASPHYHSEAENYSPHASRYYGKLAPREVEETNLYSRSVCGSNGDNAITATAGLPSVPRRRGRQSKDEQLAAANRLPLSAREISEMTLGELHKVLKNESLTEHQKQLIRKIRRRGKNKVAARTCRERRGERQRSTNAVETSWNVPTHPPEPPHQIHL